MQFAEFLDVDSDGALDLITGGHCGKKSYIFWNDGKGSYDNSNKTTIPLDYKKWGKRKCGDFYNTITQIFLLEDEKVIRFTSAPLRNIIKAIDLVCSSERSDTREKYQLHCKTRLILVLHIKWN